MFGAAAAAVVCGVRRTGRRIDGTIVVGRGNLGWWLRYWAVGGGEEPVGTES